MEQLKFDFNNMFSFNVGPEHGVSEVELAQMSAQISQAHQHLHKIISDQRLRINLGLEWARLPFQDQDAIKEIQRLGRQIAKKYENVLFLGIGGSYLGLKAAQDALKPPYYNEFVRQGPRIYFEGNNLDPDTLGVLLKKLNPKKTCVVVISKSGETTETKAAFMVAQAWLKKTAGKKYGRQIIVITDPDSGSLRKYARQKQEEDALSFRSLSLLKGVGGRFSELNMGILHLAVMGVGIAEVLDGAKAMCERCSSPELFQNPAYLYASLQHILYAQKRKSIAIVMPFSETLKSTADWYVQLLAESLGKKYPRLIRVEDGIEKWQQDLARVINLGRTPISARGTNDLHSIQQNNIEGENNKTITFIKVENFKTEVKIPGSKDLLSGRKFSELIRLAQEATEWALVRECRPNCAITMPKVSPFHWGALLFFFELATAFEAELTNLNAFDQPGVEGYKNYMYYKLGKPGLSRQISEEIKAHPLRKEKRFIL